MPTDNESLAPTLRAGPFGWNLFLLIVLGTLVTVWIATYTDYLDDFVKLLAFGGVLSWLAFVGKILSEARLKALQQGFDEKFMSRRELFAVLIVAIVAFSASVTVRATIEVRAGRQIGIAELKITDAGSTVYQKEIAAGEVVRFNASALSGRKLSVKVTGYPPADVNLGPLSRKELTIPDSFRRPLVLLRPSAELLRQRSVGLQLVTKINGTSLQPVAFRGQTLWIGADADTAVPDRLLNEWKLELDAVKAPDLIALLRVPDILSSLELHAGDSVCVELSTEDHDVYVRQEFRVRPIEKADDYPQEVTLHDRTAGSPASSHC